MKNAEVPIAKAIAKNLLFTNIDKLPWMKGMRARLYGNDLYYLGDILALSEEEFIMLPNLSRKTLAKIKAEIKPYGFHFGLSIDLVINEAKEILGSLLIKKEIEKRRIDEITLIRKPMLKLYLALNNCIEAHPFMSPILQHYVTLLDVLDHGFEDSYLILREARE